MADCNEDSDANDAAGAIAPAAVARPALSSLDASVLAGGNVVAAAASWSAHDAVIVSRIAILSAAIGKPSLDNALVPDLHAAATVVAGGAVAADAVARKVGGGMGRCQFIQKI